MASAPAQRCSMRRAEARTDRDANSRRAVVDAPAAIDGREHVGRKAAIGVRAGGEERHAFRHQRREAAGGVAQVLAALWRAVVEDVAAGSVDEAQVHVLARAGAVGIGLGHEGCLIALTRGGGLDDLAQEDGVVGGHKRIRLMAQIGLELSRRIFLAGRADGHALQAGRVVQRGEEAPDTRRDPQVRTRMVWSRAGRSAGERGGSGRPRSSRLTSIR